MSELNYSPKLKAVRREIEAIAAKHDVALHAVLHEPGNVAEGGSGYGEVFTHQPSYSRVRIAGSYVHLKSTLKDYGGDREMQRREQAATANMVGIMAELLAHAAVFFIDLQKVVDTKTGAEHGEGSFTSDSNKTMN